MTEPITHRPHSRAQFLRNTAKGAVALTVGGGVLASVQGVAFAAGVSDNSTLQAAYAAETLAVHVYTAVLANFGKFKHPALQNIDYFPSTRSPTRRPTRRSSAAPWAPRRRPA
jgi:hypothetical protein